MNVRKKGRRRGQPMGWNAVAVTLLVALGSLLQAGCAATVSIHPWFEPGEAVYEPDLVGTWVNEKENLVVIFEPSEFEDRAYRGYITPMNGDLTEFDVHLFRLDGHLLLDAYPAKKSIRNIREENFPLPVLFGHYLGRVELEGDKLKLEWLEESVVTGEKLEGETEEIEGDEDTMDLYVLTMPPSRLREITLRTLDNPNYFDSWAELRRAPPEVALYHRGIQLLNGERYDGAEAMFRAALEQRAHYADPWFGLGVLEAERGNYTGAKERFARALSLDPQHSEARTAQVIVLLTLSEPGEARRGLEKSPELLSTEEGCRLMSFSFLLEGRFDRVAEQTLQCLQRKQKAEDVLLRAIALHRLDRHEEAEALVMAHGEDTSSLRLFRDYYQGRVSDAELVNQSQECEHSFYLGHRHLSQRRPMQAREMFQHALEVCERVELGHIGAAAALGRPPGGRTSSDRR